MSDIQSLGFGCHQAQGMRAEQQDSFCMSEISLEALRTDAGVMVAVADGMGGQSNGGRASHLAVSVFQEQYRLKPPAEPVLDALRRALAKANAAVHEANKGEQEGDMGTTFTACVLQGDNLFWVSVGDSRLYLCRGEGMEKLNKEHNFGEELNDRLREGRITEQEAKAQAKKRHMLTSYLGLRHIPKVSFSAQAVRLAPGDKVILCTDGLYNALTGREMLAIAGSEESAQEKCQLFVQTALAKKRPNQDNLTALMLEYGARTGATWSFSHLSKGIKVGIAAVFVAVLVLFGYMTAVLLPTHNATEQKSEATDLKAAADGKKAVADGKKDAQSPAAGAQQSLAQSKSSVTPAVIPAKVAATFTAKAPAKAQAPATAKGQEKPAPAAAAAAEKPGAAAQAATSQPPVAQAPAGQTATAQNTSGQGALGQRGNSFPTSEAKPAAGVKAPERLSPTSARASTAGPVTTPPLVSPDKSGADQTQK